MLAASLERRDRESVNGIAVGENGECVPSGSCGSFERLVHLLNEFEVFLRAREKRVSFLRLLSVLLLSF